MTQLQKAIGNLESKIRFLQPDKLRWDHNRNELIDDLDYIKVLSRLEAKRIKVNLLKEIEEITGEQPS